MDSFVCCPPFVNVVPVVSFAQFKSSKDPPLSSVIPDTLFFSSLTQLEPPCFHQRLTVIVDVSSLVTVMRSSSIQLSALGFSVRTPCLLNVLYGLTFIASVANGCLIPTSSVNGAVTNRPHTCASLEPSMMDGTVLLISA